MGWWHDFTSSQPWVEWINDRTLKPLSEIYVKIDPMQYIMKGSAWVVDKSLEVDRKTSKQDLCPPLQASSRI